MIDSISGLTDTQRETLLAADDYGYFEIPQESSLAELATQLGISQNAASKRIRRGVKQLITETLKSDRD